MAVRSNLRVMVDTTVLVAGSVWVRWPHEILLAGYHEEFQLVLCPYIINQTRRVLKDRFPPHHLERFETYTTQVSIELTPDPSPTEVAQQRNLLVRDTTDIPVALAAINAGVDYLVSEDKDLTVQDITTEELRKRLPILLSGTFLRQVLGWTSEELEEIRYRTWSDLQK